MVKVTFVGDELGTFGWSGPASHIKLMFPKPGEAEIQMPDGDGPRPTMRTYTPRRFDPDARELDVEFFVHGDGPASTWAAHAEEGQKLILAGPGRSYALDEQSPWFILAGDESAIPAIATILEKLPPTTEAIVFIEVTDAAEERPLITLARASIQWIKRQDVSPEAAGKELENAIRTIGFPQGPGHIYVACESGAMRRAVIGSAARQIIRTTITVTTPSGQSYSENGRSRLRKVFASAASRCNRKDDCQLSGFACGFASKSFMRLTTRSRPITSA
jgi:NADPH-dependent ferric siderophore reductase